MGKIPSGLAKWQAEHKKGGNKMAQKSAKKKKKFWIQNAIKKPGALRRSLGAKKGQKIPVGKLAVAANKKGITGKRARLAQTLKSFHRGKTTSFQPGELWNEARRRDQNETLKEKKKSKSKCG